MPLKMSSELRFPMGASAPLDRHVVDEFLGLARKIHSDRGRQTVLETFKQFFCRASSEYYAQSSNLSWAESDLDRDADFASGDAAGFIAAFCGACEQLERSGSDIPSHKYINRMLENFSVPFRIIDGELIKTHDYVSPPQPTPTAAAIVSQALSDAQALIGQAGAASAIDRAHTALHAYLKDICAKSSIVVPEDITASRGFKLIRQNHPAFKSDSPRSEDLNRILQSFAASIDAFGTIRNKASLAHANELLDEPEAQAVINAIYTIFRYIQDCLHRYKHGKHPI